MTAPRTPDQQLSIRAVRAHRHRAPLLRPFITAARRTEAVDYVVAEIELADGVLGQGSAAETVAVTGEDASSILATLTGPVAAALTGASGTVAELASLISRAAAGPGTSSARAAADVALHDGWARTLGRPLADLLGAGPPPDLRRGLKSDMTVSLEEPARMAARAREAAAAGYRILKIKLGRDINEDRRRLDAVCEAVPSARLRLDANQGWAPEQAISIIASFEADGLPVDLVEQPVAADDLAGLAAVRAEVATPIMADESVWTADDARRIADAGAADLLNIKLAKTGGLREALAIADVAGAAGLSCMVGAMMEPRISVAAAAHLALAHPAISLIDLDSPEWFATRLPAGGYAIEGGWLRLAGGPGLGLDVLRADDDAP